MLNIVGFILVTCLTIWVFTKMSRNESVEHRAKMDELVRHHQINTEMRDAAQAWAEQANRLKKFLDDEGIPND